MLEYDVTHEGPRTDVCQSARKKLESRRLAYDASLAKMQKAKKEDFRIEEELRSQKAKYEETSEDVFRRMQDVRLSCQCCDSFDANASKDQRGRGGQRG